MGKGKLVRVSALGEMTETRIEDRNGPGHTILNTLVGGYFERIRVRYEGKIRDAYVDEEGLLKGLPVNSWVHDKLDGVFKGYSAPIAGPVVIWVPDAKAKANV